jgi:hypothetical protein
MSETVRIWIETSHHAAFRCGGWAFVLHDGKGLSGMAGGDRNTTPHRMVLAGVAQALKDAPAGIAVQVSSANPAISGLARRMAGFAAEPPQIDLDLWAPLTTALKGRVVTFAASVNEPKTPTAFAAAWAELARDKGKATGPFKSAIPRTNLAKAGV